MSEEEQEEPTLEAARAEVAELHQRMEEIRAATEAEVLKAWTSPWKNADTVKAKVDARLASHQEFRQIMTRARSAEAKANALDPDAPDPTAGQAKGGHPAVR
jgi:hypothetical protein